MKELFTGYKYKDLMLGSMANISIVLLVVMAAVVLPLMFMDTAAEEQKQEQKREQEEESQGFLIQGVVSGEEKKPDGFLIQGVEPEKPEVQDSGTGGRYLPSFITETDVNGVPIKNRKNI